MIRKVLFGAVALALLATAGAAAARERSVTVIIQNRLAADLKMETRDLASGSFATEPPAAIAPAGEATFRARSDSETGRTQGTVKYRKPDGKLCVFEWNSSEADDVSYAFDGPGCLLYSFTMGPRAEVTFFVR